VARFRPKRRKRRGGGVSGGSSVGHGTSPGGQAAGEWAWGGGGLQLAAALGSTRNEQYHLSIKQNFQAVLNLNQPNGGLPKLKKFK
jgi:hypothetical protein